MKIRNAWIAAGVIFGGLILAAAVMATVMRYASTHLLERDAEHTALSWAEFVGATVADLEKVFADGELTARARQDLLQFRHVQEVFRFKMFNPAGQTMLVSDDLDAPAGAAKTQSSIGHGNATVRNLVLGGENVVMLKRGAARSGRPAVFSEAYVPISRAGRVIGVVEVYVDQTARAARIDYAFTAVAGTMFALLSLVGVIAGVVFHRHLEAERIADERMRYLAHHDALSGLLNRTSFGEALQEASWRHEASGSEFSVLCIDLDHFKDVNDSLGHAAGDELLRQVGERLRSLVRHGDRVARLGGDEFALLQSGVASAKDVTTLAEKVVEVLAQPYEIFGHTLESRASVGAAIYGMDATTVEALMHKADLALYRAKAAGRGTFSFYDEALDKQLEERRQLISEMRTAIGSEQFKLHYQPQYAADGKTLKGYEALLRWTHPTLGPQGPDKFIPLAEDTGLIDPLGRWVLHTACKQAALWPDELSVAVNLSAAQFRHGDLVELVARTLDATGLPANRLELEITESLLMSNTEQVTQTLGRLAAMGVRIAMDDFGTGYSSMAYLWRFPFDKLKIDRAFTEHLDTDPKVGLIVRSIIALAHSLDIRVNAEGVEKVGQLEALRKHRCDEMQGYLLGRPVPDDQLAHLVGAGAPDGASQTQARLSVVSDSVKQAT